MRCPFGFFGNRHFGGIWSLVVAGFPQLKHIFGMQSLRSLVGFPCNMLSAEHVFVKLAV